MQASFGESGETALALFAVLEYYQRIFISLCVNYAQPRVYGVIIIVSVCMCVCLYECVFVIAVFVPCKLHWVLYCLTSTLCIPAIYLLENVKIVLTQVSLKTKRNLTKICGEPKQSG